MKLLQCALFTLSLGTLFAEETEQPTPLYFHEHAEYYDDGDPYGLELKRPKVEKDTPTKRHAKMGNADVTVEVKNIERLSESNEQQSNFDSIKKKKTEEKRKSSFHSDSDKEKEESDNPEASISIKWKIG